ncbi:MAG: UDP-glucose 4-epimerase GalE [Synergistaceae bacterium]
MKTILVTGGLGYIGSHTVIELLENNYNVVVIDNLSNSKIEVLEKIEKITGNTPKFYDGDVRDAGKLDQIFTENKIDSVIHFAGLKAVGESCEQPIKYYDNNLTGTINLIKAMKAHDCKNFVFSSSATVYGEKNPIPYIETYPTTGVSPYGQTKKMVEDIFIDICKTDKEWSVALLRYFNPIGAHKSGLIGEDPKGTPNNLFPYIGKVAVGELPYLNVWGNDYDTIDGTGVRDYIHVVDLAQGHIAALKHILDNKELLILNLGSGKGTSVLEIIHSFEKASGKKIQYKIGPRRPGDIGEYYAATQKAKEILGWETKLDIDDMCRDGWRYFFQEHKPH